MRVYVNNAQELPQNLEQVRAFVKGQLLTNRKRMIISARAEVRKDILSRKFHALIGDIVRSGFKWNGQTFDKDEWKNLLISGHTVATKRNEKLVRGLEDEIVNVRESTAQMEDERMASLVEYTVAFCAMNRIATIDDEVYA